MSDEVSGQVIQEWLVSDGEGVQLIYSDFLDGSHTEQFTENGRYKLVRCDDE